MPRCGVTLPRSSDTRAIRSASWLRCSSNGSGKAVLPERHRPTGVHPRAAKELSFKPPTLPALGLNALGLQDGGDLPLQVSSPAGSLSRTPSPSLNSGALSTGSGRHPETVR